MGWWPWSSGSSPAGCGCTAVDTTEASVLSHEIITARPYAFLDDEEFQNRRTNAVQLRRGLNVDLASIGSLDPAAIEAVHGEIQPAPESPDELHDLLSSVVALTPRPDWQELFSDLERTRSGRGRVDTAGTPMWTTTRDGPSPRPRSEGDDDAVVRAVRGHLELAGITTAEATGAIDHAPRRPGSLCPGAPSGRKASPWKAATPRPSRARNGWPGGCWPGCTRYSRRSRRQSVQPATAQDFMRFLLGWQHLSPGTQLSGREGLVSVLEQLQGFEAAAVAWEPHLLSRRLVHYSPSWLDGLCYGGETAWLRLVPRAKDEPEGPSISPSKATPITLVYRADLNWLLAAARAGGDPVGPQVGATAEVVEILADRGASFASDLARATRRLPDDIERGLWDGVARGLIMCDGFEAIRARMTGTRTARSRRFSYAARLAASTAPAAGRWSLVPSARTTDLDGHDLAEAVAEQLLNRWGVVFRDLAGEGQPPSPVAGAAVGPAPARGPGPGPGRPFRRRLLRRAVRPPLRRRPAAGRPQEAHHRGTGDRQRHRPAQPGRRHRPG